MGKSYRVGWFDHAPPLPHHNPLRPYPIPLSFRDSWNKFLLLICPEAGRVVSSRSERDLDDRVPHLPLGTDNVVVVELYSPFRLECKAYTGNSTDREASSRTQGGGKTHPLAIGEHPIRPEGIEPPTSEFTVQSSNLIELRARV